MPPRRKELPVTSDTPTETAGPGSDTPSTAGPAAAAPEISGPSTAAEISRDSAATEPAPAETEIASDAAAGETALTAAETSSDAPAADVPEENALASGEVRGLHPVLGSRLKKKERNQTYQKDRVYIRKDLKKRLDTLAATRSKGFRTLLLNYGLEKALDELEQADSALRQGEEP